MTLRCWGLRSKAAYAQMAVLAGHLPHFAFVAQFRALILLGLIAASWLILGNRRFMLFVGYIIAYPFVFVFWIVPRFALRNWAVVVAFSPAIHSILISFRSSFILFSLALISAFVLCLASSALPITACMVFLGAYLILHFVRRFRVAFSPSTVFTDVSGAIRNAWDTIKTSDIVKRPQGTDSESKSVHMRLAQRGSSIIHRTWPHIRVSARRPRHAQEHLRRDSPAGASLYAGRGASAEASVWSDAAEDLDAAAARGMAERLAGEKPVQEGGKDGEVSEKTLRGEGVRVFERIWKGGTGRFGHPCVQAERGIELERCRKR